MKSIFKKVQVHCPVTKISFKKEKKINEFKKQERAMAVAIAKEISGLAPFEKKAVALLKAKEIKKARKLLRKRIGSQRRSLKKIEYLTDFVDN